MFEVDENGVETHLIEFLRFEHPHIVIIGIDSLVVDLFRIAIGDQPLVGAERDGQLPGTGGFDRAGDKYQLGIVQVLVTFQVEDRPQHLDLHQRSPDTERFRSIAHDVEERLAFEPYGAQIAVERLGIVEAAVVVEPDLRTVGQHEAALAVFARNHKHPVFGFQEQAGAEGAESQHHPADGCNGRHTPPRCSQTGNAALFRSRGRRSRRHRLHQPLERLLIGSAVHRAELRRVPLLEQLFLRSLAARMLVQPAAELLLHLGGHVVVREIGNYVLGLFSHGFFPLTHTRRSSGATPLRRNENKIQEISFLMLPSAFVIWFSTLLGLIFNSSAISRLFLPHSRDRR